MGTQGLPSALEGGRGVPQHPEASLGRLRAPGPHHEGQKASEWPRKAVVRLLPSPGIRLKLTRAQCPNRQPNLPEAAAPLPVREGRVLQGDKAKVRSQELPLDPERGINTNFDHYRDILAPAKHEDGMLRSAFQLSVKYASLEVVPVAAAIMALSQPAVTTLFGENTLIHHST